MYAAIQTTLMQHKKCKKAPKLKSNEEDEERKTEEKLYLPSDEPAVFA